MARYRAIAIDKQGRVTKALYCRTDMPTALAVFTRDCVHISADIVSVQVTKIGED